ncbi:MAG TPA: hypothetical protein VFO62_04215 [Candidatus Binatia bacterium]|nr:hypothetical protein [Candidatus Binatia bacterium]
MGRRRGKRMSRRTALLAGLVAVMCVASTGARAADEVLARVAVPNPESPVGEVRLLRRGDATIVQTLLVTRVLPRVTAEIRMKEERNWPAARPGHADMLAYVEALNAAQEQLRAALPAADARNVAAGDRRLRLLIELSASPVSAGIEIAEFTSAAEDRPYDVASRRPLATPDVERSYVLRNMRLILADAFHLPETDVDRVGALGPAGAAAR